METKDVKEIAVEIQSENVDEPSDIKSQASSKSSVKSSHDHLEEILDEVIDPGSDEKIEDANKVSEENPDTEGKTSLKSALQLLDEIDADIGKCYIPMKNALQLLAEI